MLGWLSCKKYTESLSRSLDKPLAAHEKPMHWFHWFICFSCRRFRKQLLIIERAVKQCRDEPELLEAAGADGLSEEARSEIRRCLEQELAGEN